MRPRLSHLQGVVSGFKSHTKAPLHAASAHTGCLSCYSGPHVFLFNPHTNNLSHEYKLGLIISMSDEESGIQLCNMSTATRWQMGELGLEPVWIWSQSPRVTATLYSRSHFIVSAHVFWDLVQGYGIYSVSPVQIFELFAYQFNCSRFLIYIPSQGRKKNPFCFLLEA